ncbi:hypothetical protein TcYC6_0119560 [Trypanosoma cruzi]|uniref:Vacuolar protein sorting 55 n=1 Tax=Trypanosoma cruzi (strain CL Brener) TaxID=353153 RepID=Q4D9T1_TRYCC|nr:hypothetical protein, conserved [Trypanosoma cruzi]PBJ73828.1 hypothetical protein BCY84_13557 [Trypanosoma cruzi cruzi]EAN89287.1 hypothetical protein, conserved [Trypanosoma cruzi]KAF8281972.1 hypothetical protein TcBrA4_0082460 [Trypanosoma cruzi]KAF8291871.1 hypothetical protein TcYC6_0119560 [Trypanosoma cruzi]RNC42138.1 hypothetical protein TcCL_NonESM08258 [Trypanosoma cruzi]|eukprot:XP_811138.1 hypothetical protein [Trypanosoma cruzi strain CL Brener]
MTSLRVLVLGAFLMVVAILLAILACTVVADKNARPLLPLFVSLITPLPFVLCSRPQGSFSEESLIDGLGLFLGGALVVSGPALTCVLYHVGAISFGAFFLSISSETLLALTAYVLTVDSSNADDAYDF